jgi:hypothetical protein
MPAITGNLNMAADSDFAIPVAKMGASVKSTTDSVQSEK